MGMYDTFINKDGKEDIQVKCYHTIGGCLDTFNIGDEVSDYLMGEDFSRVSFYGDNYNIFSYELDEYVILIRDGVYADIKKYDKLTDKDCNNILCVDKYGYMIPLKTKEEYIKLHDEYYEE